MVKVGLKNEAIELRRRGYSYNLIRKQVPVSKSTLSAWLGDINFSPNQEVQNRIRGAVLAVSEWSNRNKQLSISTAHKQAKEMIGILSRRDFLLLGLGVYIGEGSKSKGNVRIINSDPRVISLAIRWFEEIFGLKTENFSLTIHLYPDNDVEQSIDFWSGVTGVPKNQFGKTQVDGREKKLKKRGMLRHGTAHLYVHSRGEKRFGILLFRTIVAMIDDVYKKID